MESAGKTFNLHALVQPFPLLFFVTQISFDSIYVCRCLFIYFL
jgi:uncharacterized membrane protein